MHRSLLHGELTQAQLDALFNIAGAHPSMRSNLMSAINAAPDSLTESSFTTGCENSELTRISCSRSSRGDCHRAIRLHGSIAPGWFGRASTRRCRSPVVPS